MIEVGGWGYEVETAADGYEALAKLSLDIDLVLRDLMMLGMDGFEVVQKIRADPENSDIPICMVTSLSGKEQRLRAVEAGTNNFSPSRSTDLRSRSASAPC